MQYRSRGLRVEGWAEDEREGDEGCGRKWWRVSGRMLRDVAGSGGR